MHGTDATGCSEALLTSLAICTRYVPAQLLFAFTPTTSSKGSTNTLKGLGLAVRGALESICGEKVRGCCLTTERCSGHRCGAFE